MRRGIPTAKLEKMAEEIGWSSLTNFSRYSLFRLVLTEGRLSTKNMDIYLRKQIGDMRFDQLPLPFVCARPIFKRENAWCSVKRGGVGRPGLRDLSGDV